MLMRRSILATVLLAIASSAAGAQAAPTTVAPVKKMTQEEATVATLTRLEQLWSTALMRRDRAAFERTLAPKFIYTRNDLLVRRPDYLRMMMEGETITDARTDSVEVHVFGNTGIVTGWRIISGRTKDGGFERRFRFTDSWMPRSGSWQMIAAHDFLEAPKK
jgi:hypothetical protein